MKTALVCGAGGFIGSHLVKRLKKEGFWVRAVDLKKNPYSSSPADEFIVGDLRDQLFCSSVVDQSFDEVYQLAADMGGAGYIFTGEHDADIMHNSASINLNIAHYGNLSKVKKIFYSSSACIYPSFNQEDPENPLCSEDSAHPAFPDSEYGWEKLFSERLFLSYARNYNLNIRIARFHNIFGPEGEWVGGKEKAPAAICRKVAEAEDGGEIEIWGDGKQTRSFLYIDECLEGVRRLMDSSFSGPVNIGSEEMVTINQLAEIAMSVAGKRLTIRHIEGPLGVRGRNSDNALIFEKLGWKPTAPLREGIVKTYKWVSQMVESKKKETQSTFWLSDDDFHSIYSKVPRLNIDLVIRSDRGVVFTKRSIEPSRGMWHLPGGTLYKGELIQDAALRVAKNETGLDVSFVRVLGAMEFPYEIRNNKTIHTVSVVVELLMKGGSLSIDKNTEAIGLFSELPTPFIDSHAAFLIDNSIFI